MVAIGVEAGTWLEAAGVPGGACPLTSTEAVGPVRVPRVVDVCGVVGVPPALFWRIIPDGTWWNRSRSAFGWGNAGKGAVTIWKVRGGGGGGAVGSGTMWRAGGGVGDLWGPWLGGNWSWKSGGVGTGNLAEGSEEEATAEGVEAGGRWEAGGSGPSGGWDGGRRGGWGGPGAVEAGVLAGGGAPN